MALMGLDIGSTGCKCAIYSEDGRQLSKQYHEYKRPAGSTEFDGAAIWDCYLEMIPAAVKEAGEPVSAVAVTSMGETFAPIGVDGEPMHAFMQSSDRRGIPYMESIGEPVRERIRAVTGLQPHPRYMLGKLLYLRNEKPEVFCRTWKYMLMEDFILYKLTGLAVSDYTISTRTNAFNLDTLSYDECILSAVGVDTDRMCRTFPAGTVVGVVQPSVARRTGLGTAVSVVTGGHDSIPEALCSGLLAPGHAALGCGTSEGLSFIVGENAVEAERMLSFSFNREPYIIPGCYMSFGVNANSGNLITWYRDNFYADVVREANDKGQSPYKMMEQRLPREPTGIITVPHFVGSSSPDFEVSARGAVTGLDLCCTRDAVYKSLLEADGYELRYIYEKAKECGIHADEIRASGGGANSDAGLQIRADILGLEIKPLTIKDTTLAGCAMMAGVATGVYSGYAEAVYVYTRLGRSIKPDREREARYNELYERYKKVRSSLVSIWANR